MENPSNLKRNYSWKTRINYVSILLINGKPLKYPAAAGTQAMQLQVSILLINGKPLKYAWCEPNGRTKHNQFQSFLLMENPSNATYPKISINKDTWFQSFLLMENPSNPYLIANIWKSIWYIQIFFVFFWKKGKKECKNRHFLSIFRKHK